MATSQAACRVTPYKVWETVSHSVFLEVLAVNDHVILCMICRWMSDKNGHE